MAAALLDAEVQSLVRCGLDFFALFFVMNKLPFIHEEQCLDQIRAAGKLRVNHRLNVAATCAHLKDIHCVPLETVNDFFQR